jgi:hypothetical protein
VTDIFENQDEIVKNLNQSANNLGVQDVMKKVVTKVVPLHKKNCKKCNGLGGFRHIAPDGKESNLPCSCVRLFQVQMPEGEELKIKAI